jgi:hypothetical protein
MRRLSVFAIAPLLTLGCNHSASSAGAPDALGEASVSSPVSSSSGATAKASARAPREAGSHVPSPCRVTGVDGTVSLTPLEGVQKDASASPALTIRASADLPDDVWVDVGKASKFSTRDATSTREAVYSGPGRFHACIDRREEAWIASGVFESVGGAGERPGGEQWVATPLGEARYGAAKLKIIVDATTVEIKVSSGTGYFWAAGGVNVETYSEAGAPPTGNDQGWVRLDGAMGAIFTSPKPVLNVHGTPSIMAECFKFAADTASLASSLTKPNADVGDIGPKHIVARRQARAACAVAALRIAALPATQFREDLAAKVKRADTQWKSLGGEGDADGGEEGVGPDAGPIP